MKYLVLISLLVLAACGKSEDPTNYWTQMQRSAKSCEESGGQQWSLTQMECGLSGYHCFSPNAIDGNPVTPGSCEETLTLKFINH